MPLGFGVVAVGCGGKGEEEFIVIIFFRKCLLLNFRGVTIGHKVCNETSVYFYGPDTIRFKDFSENVWWRDKVERKPSKRCVH